MALIAIAASVLGAAAAWWILGDRESASTGTTMVESPSIETAAPLPTPQDSPTLQEQANPVLSRSPRQGREPVVPPQSERNMAELESRLPTGRTVHGPSGEQGFRHGGRARLRLAEPRLYRRRSSNPFAEINGTEVWIGSEIEGFVVEAIEADRVILRDDKGLLILRVLSLVIPSEDQGADLNPPGRPLIPRERPERVRREIYEGISRRVFGPIPRSLGSLCSLGMTEWRLLARNEQRELATAIPNPIHIHLVDLPVIARVKPLRHAEDDPFAAVAEHQHLAGLAVEIDALDLTRPAKFGERLFTGHVCVRRRSRR